MSNLKGQLIAAVAVATLCVAGAASAASMADTKHAEALPAFDKIDTNKDGYLSVEELNKHKEVMEHFSAADADKDKKLNQDEYATIHLEKVE